MFRRTYSKLQNPEYVSLRIIDFSKSDIVDSAQHLIDCVHHLWQCYRVRHSCVS